MLNLFQIVLLLRKIELRNFMKYVIYYLGMFSGLFYVAIWNFPKCFEYIFDLNRRFIFDFTHIQYFFSI